MPGFAAVGVLSYNGYTFDGATNITVASKKVRDEAQRTVVCLQIEITVKAIIAANNSTDTTMAGIHAALSQDGGALSFYNQGFGNPLLVNTGGMKDVNWGPKAEILTWEPIGSSSACQVVWTVTTCVPECGSGTGQLMALNFEADYNIDHHGDTTRTITGYLEIPMTRGPGKSVPDTADKYRYLIATDYPDGFKRTETWHTSKNKSRLDFTIVDAQIPSNNPYPPGVTEIQARHSVKWSRSAALKFFNTITMEVTLKAGVSMTQAWLIFITIVRQRTDAAAYNNKFPFLMELGAEEELFERKASFYCRYWILSSIETFVSDVGLWNPIGTDWKQWRESLTGTTPDHRGNAGLALQPNNDAIIDLCGAPGTATSNPGNQYPQRPPQRGPKIENKQPPAPYSWLDYKAQIVPSTNNPYVRHTVLQTPSPDIPLNDPNGTGGYALPAPSQSITKHIIQKRGVTVVTFRFVGHAIRAGHEITEPNITSIGGTPVTRTKGRFACRKTGMYFGQPVYSAQWDITYIMDTTPANKVAPPDNVQEPNP